jgi:hypothetical protein
MGLFDGYFDPQQFDTSGGLLGRLLSLQRQQGILPDQEFDPWPPAPPAPQLSPVSLANWEQAMSAQNHSVQYGALPSAPVGQSSIFAGIHPAYGNTPIAQAAANPPQSVDPSAVNSVGYPRPVVSDASPDPITPGAQYVQAPMALCATGPFGCAAGAGLTAAQAILGGAALGGLGAIILNNNAERPPAGSRPINETPWSGDHQEIKKAVDAGSTDNVKISPTSEVWAQNPDGSWTNHGPADSFTGSGKPSGRRGKDRD